MRKLNTILFYIFFTFISFSLLAQKERLTFLKLDSITYKQYLQKDWNNLIKYAKAGLRQNIDFYYLRIRLADAYLAKHQTRKAIRELEKALEMNGYKDKYALNLLYISYIKTGDFIRAHYISTLLGNKDKKIEQVYLSTAYASYNSDKLLLEKEPKQTDVSANLLKQFKSYDIALNMYKGKRLWSIYSNLIYSSGTYYEINNKNIYSNLDFSNSLTDISATKYIAIKNKLTLYYDFNIVFEKYKTSTYRQSKSMYFATSSGLSFSTSYFSATSQISISHYSPGIQIIPSQTITLYPFASPVFYLQSSFNYISPNISSENENIKSQLLENPYVISGSLGLNIKRISIYGFYYQGSIYNFYEAPAIHYITPYIITSQLGGGINVFFNNVSLNLLFSLQNGNDFIKHETPDDKYFESYKLSIQLIKGGILWNF
jgi:hypothetical protein